MIWCPYDRQNTLGLGAPRVVMRCVDARHWFGVLDLGAAADDECLLRIIGRPDLEEIGALDGTRVTLALCLIIEVLWRRSYSCSTSQGFVGHSQIAA